MNELVDLSPALHMMAMGALLAAGPLGWLWLRNRKASPVHLFWGALDLSYMRFSGRPAEPPPGADVITRAAGGFADRCPDEVTGRVATICLVGRRCRIGFTLLRDGHP